MSNSDSDVPVRMRSPIPISECGASAACAVIGDRWALLILRDMFFGVMRFDDLQADLDIPKSVLTGRLKALVEAGLVERFSYQEPGARRRAAYRMSPAGQDLWPVLVALMEWGDRHMRGGTETIEIRSGDGGEKLKLGLVPVSATPPGLADLQVRPAGAAG